MHFKVIKQKISVRHIGKTNFYLGIGLGVFAAMTLSLFFNYGRELFRFLFSALRNLVELEANRQMFFNYFYAALSVSLGTNLMLWVWQQRMDVRHIFKRRYIRLAQLSAIFVFWMILEVVVRFGSATPWGYAGYFGDQPILVFTGESHLLFYLLPFVIFLHGWHTFRLAVRCFSWMGYTFVAGCILSFMLAHSTSVNSEVIEDVDAKLHAEFYAYIDSALADAEQKYDIKFSEEEVDDMKERGTVAAIAQVRRMKEAFADKKPVSLKTIILQRISVGALRPRDTMESFNDYWPYARPKDIQRQLENFFPASDETEELILLLQALVDLYNTPRPTHWDNIDSWEIQKHTYKRSLFRLPSLVASLENTIQTIKAEPRYAQYPIEDLNHVR
ncbi:hypothetical protein WJR50_21020 [Catalinimonas sp. 4WD22]|uniref:hypothetical protein n=1 Tax=Catalinimonas locisalis TaxID=3133978 RepID=UPI0031016AAD